MTAIQRPSVSCPTNQVLIQERFLNTVVIEYKGREELPLDQWRTKGEDRYPIYLKRLV